MDHCIESALPASFENNPQPLAFYGMLIVDPINMPIYALLWLSETPFLTFSVSSHIIPCTTYVLLPW